MKYLIDTDWIIDLLKGKRETVAKVLIYTQEGMALSLVSYGEIYDGIIHGLHRQRHEQGFQRFLESVELLPLDMAIMQRFAQIRGDLRSQGQLIGDFDLLIAATALHHNLTLLTNNRSHFQCIPDLRLSTSFN